MRVHLYARDVVRVEHHPADLLVVGHGVGYLAPLALKLRKRPALQTLLLPQLVPFAGAEPLDTCRSPVSGLCNAPLALQARVDVINTCLTPMDTRKGTASSRRSRR